VNTNIPGGDNPWTSVLFQVVSRYKIKPELARKETSCLNGPRESAVIVLSQGEVASSRTQGSSALKLPTRTKASAVVPAVAEE
jgi:hypothetical protein